MGQSHSVLATWHDPITWGPPGLGCRLCHDNPPYRMAICLSCLVRCLGWNVGIILKWVERQDASYVRQEARMEALRLWRKQQDPAGIIRYAEEYGVWLVDSRTIHQGVRT